MDKNRKNLRNVATIVACLAVTVIFASCKKDTPEPEKTNYYTYDSKTFNVVWAGYYSGLDFYTFGIFADMPDSVGNVPNFFVINVPKSLIGQKIDMSKSWTGLSGTFRYDNKNLDFSTPNVGLTETNNWINVAHNSGDDFTFEFNMTIDGKLLAGKYVGTFLVDSNGWLNM